MNVQEAVNKRYSERYMESGKKISDSNLKTILEAGIKAPCGYGSEPWKFLVIDGDRSSLLESTNNQIAVKDSSHLVVCLYNKLKGIKLDSEYYEQKMKAKNATKEKIEINKLILHELGKSNYMREQCFFAASQMVLQATALGIDSLIMGGIDPDSLAKDLKIDSSRYGIAIIVAFGYAKTPVEVKRQTKKFEDVVEFKTL